MRWSERHKTAEGGTELEREAVRVSVSTTKERRFLESNAAMKIK